MRNAFVEELVSIARSDQRVWIICGDLGYGVLDEFRDVLPSQFVNAGVAEQNMTGLATGLALEGRIAFTYSIANFSTLRCLEQVRNDVCYHNANVKIVSVGAGLAYGTHGYTHYAIEDLGILSWMPNMKILCPADPLEARSAAHLAVNTEGPIYIRLGKNGEPKLHPQASIIDFGEMALLDEGSEGILIACGSIGYNGRMACQTLRANGIDIGFASSPSVKPIDRSFLDAAFRKYRFVVTLEEH